HCSKAARAQLRHDDHNDSTACRMRYLYALRYSLSVVTAAIQPRLRLSGTNRLRFALHGGWRPMRRMGLPEEIAAAVAFLAADEQAYLTGANLPVNGGLFIH
ncbi:MAG: SDR family oxidoreductase, partial [gamma proteobacterium symbiont of Phacoides pectinatus]